MTRKLRLARSLRQLQNRQASRRKNFFRSLQRGFEPLEDRSLLATLSASLVGGDLSIVDIDGAGKDNNLAISTSGSDLIITDNNESFLSAPAGGSLTNGDKTLTIPLASITGTFTIDAAGGTDAITVNALSSFLAGFTIGGGAGLDTVNFAGDLTLASGKNLAVTAETVNVSTGADLAVSGSVAISLTADDLSIDATATLNAGSSTVTILPQTGGRQIDLGSETAGRLSLTDAEMDRITAGTLAIGNASNGTVTISAAISHANNLTLVTGAGITFNSSVTMAADKSFAVANSGATTAITLANTNADITTSGTGAVSLTASRNISLVAGSSVTTVNGGITFTANPTGTATGNFSGIHVDGATLLTLGSGNISLLGFGADQAGTQLNAGVVLRNSTLVETRSSGNITLDGTGGNGTIFNDGIHIVNSIVNSTASATGKITMIGHGAATATGLDNRGVAIGLSAIIRSQGSGDLEFTGTGGITTSSNSFGFYLDSSIQSSGTGKITITGTGGSGVNYMVGVWLNGGQVTSASGDVAITGTGGTGSGSPSHGIWMLASADIISTGGAKTTLTGTGGSGLDSNRGIEISGSGTTITSNGGDIHFVGQGGTSASSWNVGFWQYGGAVVAATGSAKVTIEGTGGSGVDDNNGVLLNGFGQTGATQFSAQNGDITIIGQGGLSATGAYNRGFGAYTGSVIQSTGLGKINIEGTGGGGSDSARGVELVDSGSRISSATGDIRVTGQGGLTSGRYSFGVWVVRGAVIESSDTASISIVGTGGAGGGDNNGVIFNGYGHPGATFVRSVEGDITITGTGGDSATGVANRGVSAFEGAAIESSGSGTISIDGTAGSGLRDQRGVDIGDANTRVTSVHGDISITGHGAAGTDLAETYNSGVWIHDNAVVESTAISGTAATITIDGTGGPGANLNAGVWLSVSGSITSELGDIHVTGEAGDGTGPYNLGVILQTGGSILSTGSAAITAIGTGGAGTHTNAGIWVLDANSKIQSVDGAIDLTGEGGAGTGNWNMGLIVSAGSVKSTGQATITLDGTGGTGIGDARGVEVTGFVTTTHGDITVNGRGGMLADGPFNSGVAVFGGGRIEALPGGSASVTVAGTGGTGTSILHTGELVDAVGVWIFDPTSSVIANDGDIAITGIGGGSTGSDNNHGVLVWGDSDAVRSTGAGSISRLLTVSRCIGI